jgi:hypothetical protein
MNIQIINTEYNSDNDLLEASLFNSSTGKVFTLLFRAYDFDKWCMDNLPSGILDNDLWSVYDESPSLFQQHTAKFITEEIEQGLAV